MTPENVEWFEAVLKILGILTVSILDRTSKDNRTFQINHVPVFGGIKRNKPERFYY